MIQPPMTGNQSDDPIGNGPPIPSFRSAQSGSGQSSMAMPRPSPAALELTGSSGAGSVIQSMMMIEPLIKKVSATIPALTNVANPFIQQMRSMGAAALADQAGGGMGATNPEVTAAPPMDGPMGAPPAGGGIMPPPPMAGGGGTGDFISQSGRPGG